jgi:hypothetical protein
MTEQQYIMYMLQQQKEKDEKKNKKGILDTSMDYAGDVYEGFTRAKDIASSLAGIIAGTGQYNVHNIVPY